MVVVVVAAFAVRSRAQFALLLRGVLRVFVVYLKFHLSLFAIPARGLFFFFLSETLNSLICR